MEDKTAYAMEPAASKHPYGAKVIECEINYTPEPLAELEYLRQKAVIYEAALKKIASGSLHYTWSMMEAARKALAKVEEVESQ